MGPPLPGDKCNAPNWHRNWEALAPPPKQIKKSYKPKDSQNSQRCDFQWQKHSRPFHCFTFWAFPKERSQTHRQEDRSELAALLKAAAKPELEGCAKRFAVMQQASHTSLSTSALDPTNNSAAHGWDSLYQDKAQQACVVFQIFLVMGNDRQIIWLRQKLDWALHFSVLQFPHLQTGDNITSLWRGDHIALLHL